jgi:hypothetical protein
LEADSGAEWCHGGFRADLVAHSGAEWCHGGFRADLAAHSRAGNKKEADQKGQLRRLLFKICVITQFTYYS